jgi:hypothetical protein
MDVAISRTPRFDQTFGGSEFYRKKLHQALGRGGAASLLASRVYSLIDDVGLTSKTRKGGNYESSAHIDRACRNAVHNRVCLAAGCRATSPAMKACSQQWADMKNANKVPEGEKVVGFLESVQQGFCGQERRRHSDGRKAFGREAG